ncbi:GGDEF domain-containing protein [Kosmotoga sp.]|uniref:GGDEF domain-containing protein n=1 Tax=Kosmotoga sp. TaxID=1955248 RepID=UPI00258CD781|nr:GGDEF domain-containing protein [Kosmotoga sp.]
MNSNEATRGLSIMLREGILETHDGLYSFKDRSFWKKIYNSLNVNQDTHLQLALLRELEEGILFHYKESGLSSDKFIFFLLWKSREDIHRGTNYQRLLLRKNIIKKLSKRKLWALDSIELYLQDRTEKPSPLNQETILKWIDGSYHVNPFDFIRVLQKNYPPDKIKNIIKQKLQSSKHLSDYERMVLKYFILESECEISSDEENLKKLSDFAASLPSTTYGTARLKASAYNRIATYFISKQKFEGFKEYLHKATKIAEKFELNFMLPRLYNNLSIYYDAIAPNFAQEIQEKAMKLAKNNEDLFTSAFIGINLAQSYFFYGKQKEFQEILSELTEITKKIENPEILVRYKHLKMLVAVYNDDYDGFEKLKIEVLEDLKTFSEPMYSSLLSRTMLFEFLIKVIWGDFQNIEKEIESLRKMKKHLNHNELLFLEITQALLEDEKRGYDVFRSKIKEMKLYIEETLQTTAFFVDKENYEDFVKECKERIRIVSKLVSHVSLAQIYYALAIASKRIGKLFLAKQYFKKASIYFTLQGINTKAREIKNKHLHEDVFIDSVLVLEKLFSDTNKKSQIPINQENYHEVLWTLNSFISLMAAFGECNSLEEIMNVFSEFIQNHFPITSVRTKFDWLENMTKEIGSDKIPPMESRYSQYPFYVSYEFDIDFEANARIEIYNPYNKASMKEIEKFNRLMGYLEPLLTLVFRNYMRYTMATKDALTGLYTRWYFESRLEEEFARSRRFGEEFSVIMCDLDNFKVVNDSHGHIVGDEILKKIAKILLKGAREMDIVGRYGGEEFIILLPYAKHRDAVRVAERLKELIEANKESLKNVTASFGVASYPAPDINNAADLLFCADQRCYLAKKLGKNRVVGGSNE